MSKTKISEENVGNSEEKPKMLETPKVLYSPRYAFACRCSSTFRVLGRQRGQVHDFLKMLEILKTLLENATNS